MEPEVNPSIALRCLCGPPPRDILELLNGSEGCSSILVTIFFQKRKKAVSFQEDGQTAK